MTATTGPGPRRPLQVDPDHPGTGEAAWATSPGLSRVGPLGPLDVDAVVVVAPHPDDEVLGSGGLLRALAARGTDLEVLAVTDGEAFIGGGARSPAELGEIRRAESVEALGRLGLPGIRRTRLGHPDGAVAGAEAQLADELAVRLRPGVLCLAPWRSDGHPDHDACGRAAASATAATGAVLVEYLVWAWHWARPDGDDIPWAACRRVDLDARAVAAKRWAIDAFVSQTTPFGAGDAPPVLPPAVVHRFTRPFEVFIT